MRGALPVLLPFRAPERGPPTLTRAHLVMLAVALAALAPAALAQASGAPLSPLAVVWKWTPLLLAGFGFNLLISFAAMAIGTAAGFGLGLAQLGSSRVLRGLAWALTQFFRNSPWLVLLFFAMFLIPFQVRIGGVTIPLPDWLKAIIGFALPVMANVSEIVRGAVRSVPTPQWESADSLAFTPRQTMWMIILPQCIKRMIPPWMNVYSLITMATVQASVVGVTEMLTLTGQVHAAEGGRPELFAPLYGFALLCFFVYCYPIDLMTARLERRFQVR
ncbi:amino acid ABC transporter permease [Enterovirga sp.]|uniref:amino acid ABC transporter permease n=1 Tax=Enterovirga sp. TaxID=2026350 RepID=UPI00263647A8|nr:amino acid ABC transporter permease [Enterovirga sp.]MDB5590036.1 polar amino acid transporter, inner rane subunit [Enterovirga sp.]